MTKFIKVQSTAQHLTYFINVEMVKYVVQNAQVLDQSSVRIIGDEHPIAISESAASLIDRIGVDLV
jgi:hypothetical protein